MSRSAAPSVSSPSGVARAVEQARRSARRRPRQDRCGRPAWPPRPVRRRRLPGGRARSRTQWTSVPNRAPPARESHSDGTARSGVVRSGAGSRLGRSSRSVSSSFWLTSGSLPSRGASWAAAVRALYEVRRQPRSRARSRTAAARALWGIGGGDQVRSGTGVDRLDGEAAVAASGEGVEGGAGVGVVRHLDAWWGRRSRGRRAAAAGAAARWGCSSSAPTTAPGVTARGSSRRRPAAARRRSPRACAR